MDGDPIAPNDEQHKEQDDDRRPDKAQLLTDDGEDVVILRLGQVEEFLAALAQAHTQQAAGADGVQGLDGLEAAAPAVHAVVPGILPDGQTGGHVAGLGHDEEQAGGRGGTAADEPVQPDASGKEHRRAAHQH